MNALQEEFLRGHMDRMKKLDDRARDSVSVLAAENCRNIISNGDAVVGIQRQLGKTRIDEIIASLK